MTTGPCVGKLSNHILSDTLLGILSSDMLGERWHTVDQNGAVCPTAPYSFFFYFFFYYIKSSFRNKPDLPDEVHCIGGNINSDIMILLIIIIMITNGNNNKYRSTVLKKEGFYMIWTNH